MKQKPNEVDRAIGRRVRMRRSQIGLSHHELADALDVPVEQVSDFETGAARISAEHLHILSGMLGVRPVYFFDLLLPIGECSSHSSWQRPLQDRLLHAFQSIDDSSLKTAIVELVETVVASTDLGADSKVIRFPLKIRD